MKRLTAVLMILILLFSFSACGQTRTDAGEQKLTESVSDTGESDTDEPDIIESEETEEMTATTNNILVAYFSATGTTRPLAEYAADILNADIYEIMPEDPYTDEDLDYYSGGRADQEQDDPSARPAISGSVEEMDNYDIVFIGYPIWHGQAPRIISTFLESYDFSGKTIVPFCTSHSSGIGSSDTNLHALADSANWLAGSRFAAGTSRSEIENWIGGFDLPEANSEENKIREFNFDTASVILNSGYEMPINGLGTYNLHGDECINSVKAALSSGVRLFDTASAYGNEEEVLWSSIFVTLVANALPEKGRTNVPTNHLHKTNVLI